ncbi:hypothetical protein L596_026146 [Steinernema carpocapsae]|uniref:ShKT domain-containing protein n=1 Tax=Steinernema carpocapsae TaxID=34508 RepID=A0A4U5M0I1_STECR|nr:hypothetical protein L596_026146 [Steinernema carpocapsae]
MMFVVWSICLIFAVTEAQDAVIVPATMGASCIGVPCQPGLHCNPVTQVCQECADAGPFCKDRKQLCKDPEFQFDLEADCPRTCNVCRKPGEIVDVCLDRLSTCSKNKKFCTHRLYTKFLSEQCPKTCGICTSNLKRVVVDDCGDMLPGQNDCAMFWALDYCNNFDVYSEDIVRRTCGDTCGKCLALKEGEIKVRPPIRIEDIIQPSKGVVGTPECGDNWNGTKGNCAQFKRKGYCTRLGFYTLDNIKKNCGITCGLCKNNPKLIR